MRRVVGAIAIVLIAALLSACAGPRTQVILLPQPDGRPSGVVVTTKSGTYVITQPFERATTMEANSLKAPRIDWSDLVQMKTAYPELFDLMPPKAEHFVLYFDANGVVLTSQSRKDMQTVLAAARSRSGSDLVVTGHTDTMGTAKINDTLSLRRAMEVRQQFIAQDFPSDRIEAVGRGRRDLAIATPAEVDEPRNRRVAVDVR